MKKVTLDYGMAGKEYNGENPLWFGRSWGFWRPRYSWNGGKLSKGECVHIQISWLCFWIGVIIWGSTKKSENNIGREE